MAVLRPEMFRRKYRKGPLLQALKEYAEEEAEVLLMAANRLNIYRDGELDYIVEYLEKAASRLSALVEEL